MTSFVFSETVPTKNVSAALGVDANNKFVDADLGKAVKLGTAQNYVPCAAGDEIDGFVTAIEPFTVNDGFSFGGVQLDNRKEAMVGTGQVGSMAVGDYVVAAPQVALGTAGIAQVKTGVPTKKLWRCIRIISGTGAVGDKVLLELV